MCRIFDGLSGCPKCEKVNQWMAITEFSPERARTNCMSGASLRTECPANLRKKTQTSPNSEKRRSPILALEKREWFCLFGRPFSFQRTRKIQKLSLLGDQFHPRQPTPKKYPAENEQPLGNVSTNPVFRWFFVLKFAKMRNFPAGHPLRY